MNRTTLTSTLLVTTLLLWAGGAVGQSLPPLDEVEQQAMSDTLQYSLEYNKTDQPADWVNPDTGRTGAVLPVRTYVNNQGLPCREFITTITIDGEQEQGYGTACRQPNGTWYIVSDAPSARVALVPSQPMHVYQPVERYYVSPYTYYNPYPINFSFSYLFHGGSLSIGNYYPGGPLWYPRTHWQPNRHRYYTPYWPRPHYRPHYRPHHRPNYRPNYRSNQRQHYRR